MIAQQLGRLAKHSAIYGLGAVVSRLISVFLLPVFTRFLTEMTGAMRRRGYSNLRASIGSRRAAFRAG